MMGIPIRLPKKVANWLIAGYILALLLLSVVSFNGNYSLSKKHLVGIRVDYVIHATFFLPWMILANLRWNVSNRCKLFWFILSIGLALAATSEFMQLLIPQKTFNFMDLISNELGVCLGALICFLFLGGWCRQKRV